MSSINADRKIHNFPERNMNVILNTPRLMLREIVRDDRTDMAEILQDPEAMYAYEHAFSSGEVDAWLDRQLRRYEQDGHGLWAVICRESGAWLGMCGLTIQNVENTRELEVGYLFKRRFWHRGYAREAAAGCRDYAFNVLGTPRLVACVRVNNAPSRRVAESLGMKVERIFVKHYYDMDMPHALYVLELPGTAHRKGK
ncbi:GNAT family N-acetyltransferase [uncultured Victivallis sp.]|uniref:GNAT family N-acetyltransferase n=1 Tax=uncultured Victivallis sp. TaxID=354118 RepID=UPI0025D0FFF2|nr:GNAT family N-acetyltransferase [uncultured Victivallis sp.]